MFLLYLLSIDAFIYLFFFSSRRRHTRSTRDWSSDVCSSDLLGPGRELVLLRDRSGEHERDARRVIAACEALEVDSPILRNAGSGPPLVRLARLMAFVDHLS